jgi:hypothetical protein
MKLCCKCKTTKPYSNFYANKASKDGFNTFCKDCHKADNVARKKVNRQKLEFKQQENEYKKLYRSQNANQHKEYMKKWHQQHTVEQRLYREQYRKENPQYFKDYVIANKHRINARTRKRQAAKIQRTPAWLTEDDHWMIEEAYALAALRTELFGFSWHVDHILPLQGKTVSGLHVPLNLQVISAQQNYRKSNRVGA